VTRICYCVNRTGEQTSDDIIIHGKNGSAEISKNLAMDIDLKIILLLLSCQNNCIGCSNWLLEYLNFFNVALYA